MDVEQHGAGSVGHVGGVYGPAGELPQQPAVHRAEQNFALLGPGLCALHMVEDPADLGGGKIGVRQQTGGLPDVVGQALGHQTVHDGRGAAALPDDGVVDGHSGGLVPQDGGLALVRDADGGKVRSADVALGDDLHHHGVLAGPDLHGVVLHPALFRVELGELLLADGGDVLLFVKQDSAGAGGALVEGEDVSGHGKQTSCMCVFLALSIAGFTRNKKRTPQ